MAYQSRSVGPLGFGRNDGMSLPKLGYKRHRSFQLRLSDSLFRALGDTAALYGAAPRSGAQRGPLSDPGSWSSAPIEPQLIEALEDTWQQPHVGL